MACAPGTDEGTLASFSAGTAALPHELRGAFGSAAGLAGALLVYDTIHRTEPGDLYGRFNRWNSIPSGGVGHELSLKCGGSRAFSYGDPSLAAAVLTR